MACKHECGMDDFISIFVVFVIIELNQEFFSIAFRNPSIPLTHEYKFRKFNIITFEERLNSKFEFDN